MSFNGNEKILNNGKLIPSIGFGTSLINGEECINAIKNAIKIGYRHIDTASAYENEIEIGKAIKQCNIERKKLFITSKVWIDSMGYENTIKSFNQSLKNLDVEYVDLYLIHWPKNNNDEINIETWKALEEIYKTGKARAIGVSNFLVKHLKPLLEKCEIMPMVNQLEYHPGLIRKDIIEYCKNYNILIEAWSPLGKGRVLNNNELIRLADKYNKSVAQICLRWCIQNEIIPLPKSQNESRMKENIDIFNFELSEEDIVKINNIEFFAGSNMDPNNFN